MQKSTVHQTLTLSLLTKYDELNMILAEASDGKSNDAKSSAGDKHEVGVAMVQLEQEKLGKQLLVIQDQLDLLAKIDLNKTHQRVSLGSLILCNKQWYYFTVGLGMLKVMDEPVFCLNPQAPLGIALIGKSVQDEITFQGKKMVIERIF
ncbi:MAG: 3-oxoacyl-ACP synthase [Flavobacteriales bacterium]